MESITKEQEEFLNKCTKGTWELNWETGLVDIDGSFDCSEIGLSDFKGIEFGKVREDFYCYYNNLVSLEGAPREVGWDFHCSHNQLVSLSGAPREIGRDFHCSYNKLVSLEGAPREVGWDFHCSHNQLVSLSGAPREVGRDFHCFHNQLVSLSGAPREVGRNFYCDVMTPRGCPINLSDKIYFRKDVKYFRLKELINNGLSPEIYLKKMV